MENMNVRKLYLFIALTLGKQNAHFPIAYRVMPTEVEIRLCHIAYPLNLMFTLLLFRFIWWPVLGVVNRCMGNAAVYAVQPTQVQPNLVTQTVYGFLDFTTTIGNTVMVFSPQSAPPPGKSLQKTKKIIIKFELFFYAFTSAPFCSTVCTVSAADDDDKNKFSKIQ